MRRSYSRSTRKPFALYTGASPLPPGEGWVLPRQCKRWRYLTTGAASLVREGPGGMKGELGGGVHALLGDEQHSSAQNQDGAQHVEDGGTHAAGGGQLGPVLFATSTIRLFAASTLTGTGSFRRL